jgi:hypothetical protein
MPMARTAAAFVACSATLAPAGKPRAILYATRKVIGSIWDSVFRERSL